MASGGIVEVWPAVQRRGYARRDEKLRRLGYHIVRVQAALVLQQAEAAVALVRQAVESVRR